MIATINDAVSLHVISIDVKVVDPLLVHKRVEVDSDQVVHWCLVTVDSVRAHHT